MFSYGTFFKANVQTEAVAKVLNVNPRVSEPKRREHAGNFFYIHNWTPSRPPPSSFFPETEIGPLITSYCNRDIDRRPSTDLKTRNLRSLIMPSSPERHTPPKIIVESPASPDHAAELMLSRSRSNSLNDPEDDDRTPFLDNSDPESGWRIKLNKHSERVRNFSRSKRNVIVGLLSVILVVLIVVWFMSWRLFDRESSSRGGNRQLLVHGQHGAVATELDICSNIGVKMLQEGGNAVDAAIASGICIGSINMFSAGIGGFASIR